MALWKGAGMKLRMKDGWCRALCSGAEVGVFWDLNKCGVEDVEMRGEGKGEGAVDASHIAPNICKVLRSSGFSGPISIRAYGNTRSFSNHRVTQALLATGVDLHHISGGMKYLWKHLILDLLLWARESSAPAHVLLISGDKDFSSVLHKLHMRGYDVLLAHPEGDICRDLLSAASKIWVWDKMMKGTEVSVLPLKYSVLPPSYRPRDSNESQCSHNQEVRQPELGVKQDFMCDNLKRKPQNIPKEVVDQVLDIIRLRPSGFTASAFRRQLARSNVILDKDFYGHKDLLSFLLSIPNLKARLIWTTDRNRTFYFTEDLNGSPHLNTDGKEVLSTSPDHNKIAKQEIFKAEQGKRQSGNKVKDVLCDGTSPKESSSKKSIADVDLSLDSSAAKLLGLFSRGTSALSAVWNTTLSKLIALKTFVGPEAVKMERTILQFPLPTKGKERKPKSEDINAESCISSGSAPSIEEEKQGDFFHKEKSRETVEWDVHKAMYETLQDRQEKSKSESLKKSNVLASSDSVGKQQATSERSSGSDVQGRHRGLPNELEATSPLLQEGKNVITDAKLTNEMCDDVLLYLFNESSIFVTGSITMDDVLKVLLESNLKGIAELKQEELIQLSKACHEKMMLQVESTKLCDTKSKASKYHRVLAEKESSYASPSTINPDAPHLNDGEGGRAIASSLATEEENCSAGSTIHKYFSLIEHITPKVDVLSDMPEASVRHDMCETAVRHDIEKMLLDLLQKFEDGVDLVFIKSEFRIRYGYDLNNKALGYPTLSSFLNSLEGFTLVQRHEKKLILRSLERAVDKERVDEGNEGTFKVSS